MSRDALRRVAKALRSPGIIIVLYLFARFAFARMTEDDGLLTPESAPKPSVVIAGIVVIVLRLVVVAIVPPLLAWRVVRVLAEKYISRSNEHP